MTETVEPAAIEERAARGRDRRGPRLGVFPVIIATVVLFLFGVPLLELMILPDWPLAVTVIGTIIVVLGAAAMPFGLVFGHGRRGLDWAARMGDTLLGVAWVMFTCSVLGNVVWLVLFAAGVDAPARWRIVALAALGAALVLLAWGYMEAMRVPRIKRVDVAIPRLGAGLDGAKVVLITDTHYGPINRERWSAGLTAAVNALDPDIVCHTGDIADGTVDRRHAQAQHLGDIRARLARTYVTGNHEYFGHAQGWLDYMRELGWEPLHNRHITVERGGDRLVIAGIDDRTAAGSGNPGHRADPAAALSGADPELPVLMLAHQPKQVTQVAEHGADLQLSGHTHGGQIWPFHLLVLTDQPVLAGLSRHGERTQLYTSRGSGFWGPPFRVFAPSEITELTLRASGLA
jgi:predicted MPP superfamily phosphohydrolase